MGGNPVTRIAKIWFSIEGVNQDRTAYGFIGSLYKAYGEDILLQAFDIIQNRPSQAKDIKNPQAYIRGICRKIVLDSPSPLEGREGFDSMIKDFFKEEDK